MSANTKKLIKNYAALTLACLIYAISYVWCFDPNRIAFGGLTGISQIINNFFPAMPIGLVTFVLNVPLFALGWELIGGHLLISSLYAVAVSSAFIDILDYVFEWQPMDPLLACLFGGVILGTGLGFVFLNGATTGGTDLGARLLKLKIQWIPVGKLLLLIEIFIVSATALAFGDINVFLYGIIANYVSTLVMDRVIYGSDRAKVAYIISDRSDEITESIMTVLSRGITILHGEGGYTGNSKKVLMCAFKQQEIAAIKDSVKSIDPDAFLIVCEAHEVLGDGFSVYKKNDL